MKIIDVDKFLRDVKAKGPVSSTEIYESVSSKVFNNKGLFSEVFFGIDGSKEFKENYSWIDLNCYVIHPFLFDLLKKRIERNIVPLISSEKTFSVDKNGYLKEDPDGELFGMSSLYKNIRKISFRKKENLEGDDDLFFSDIFRIKLVKLIEESIKNDTFFVDKLIVIPPFFRPITVLSSGEVSIDPLNDIYRRILILSQQIRRTAGLVKDILNYRLQLVFSELLDFCRTKLSKKSGLIRSQMLGRRVDFSARAVISPNPKIDFGYVGIPLRQVCQLFEPFILYGLVNSEYVNQIPEEFHKQVKEFLGREKEIEVL